MFEGVDASVEEGLAAYNRLLRELSPGHEPISRHVFEGVLRQPSELVVFMLSGSKLLGTAQASLCFPGCRPTIWISRVVVTEEYRGCGLGRRLMEETEELIKQRFAQYRPLSVMLTSRSERGTESFYRGFGYDKRETNRYQKKL
jgi:GNAT superfamily N-acetyltransferase